MRLELDNYNLKQLLKLFEVNDENIDVLSFLRTFLTDYPTLIKMDDVLSNVGTVGIDKSYVFKLIAMFNLDYQNPFVKKIVNDYLLKGVSHLSSKDYVSNPYIQNIKFNNVKNNNWDLKNSSYQPFEAFVYNSHVIEKDNYYREIPSIGFFLKEFNFPAVFENDNMWMSVTPNEINTMKEPINKAKGNCLTFGLGLGYYIYMISLKDDVKNITVVEKDENVIKLFKENILPHFKHKEKIKIIKDDAFKYMKNNDLSKFDHIFVDLWHDSSDGIFLYLESLKYLKDLNADYWIEDSIILLYRKMVITLLKDLYMEEDNNYGEYQTIYGVTKIIKKDEVYHSYEEIKETLSDKSLKEALIKIANVY